MALRGLEERFGAARWGHETPTWVKKDWSFIYGQREMQVSKTGGPITSAIPSGRRATYSQHLCPKAHKVTALVPLSGCEYPGSESWGPTMTTIPSGRRATYSQHLRLEPHKVTVFVLLLGHEYLGLRAGAYNDHQSKRHEGRLQSAFAPRRHTK
ncbi:hypothetical protein NDU88_007793 [Pleurodeles waltl]|uniref:Uncharacterized protein n=1 Tax=Pleurodeles waltl TaxID=8319 RepID=A0AAV7VTP3_PLEWA|nr:hypothetical protein NDU88_007793 [Pleurodeles waltl]